MVFVRPRLSKWFESRSLQTQNQPTGWWPLQYWNLPCYAEIGWLVSFYQPEKLLQSTFSTQTTKNKTTKNILERNKIALMKWKDAALVCIQINPTLPLECTELRSWILQQLFFRSGARRTGLFKFGFWYKYPRKMGGEDTGEEIFYQKIPQIEVETMRTKLVLLGHMWLWFPLRPAIYGLFIAPLLVLLHTLTWLNTSLCTGLHCTFW